MDPSSSISRRTETHKPVGDSPPALQKAKISIDLDPTTENPSLSSAVEDLSQKLDSDPVAVKTQEVAHPIILEKMKHRAVENNDFFNQTPADELHLFKLVKEGSGTLIFMYHGRGPDLASEKGCKKLLGHCKSKELKYVYTKMPKEKSKPQFMVFHKEHAEQLAGMKLVIKADASANPEIKKMADDLNGEPITFAYMSSEGLMDLQAKLTLMMVPFQAGSAEPHAKTSSEDIRKLHEASSKKEAEKTKDPFANAKEVLMLIFLSSYQEKLAIEQERTRKAREEEKENKLELERKDRVHDIEKKEQKDATDNLELTDKTRNRHRIRQKESLEIDSKLGRT